MAKKKATGMSKRVGYLDRDVINENREILRYNQKVEREEQRAAQQKEAKLYAARVESTLFEGVGFPNDTLKDAAKALLEVVARRGRFGEGAKAGWQLLKEQLSPAELEEGRLQWNTIVHKAGVNASKANLTRVPSGILKETPELDPIKGALITAGMRQPGSQEVKKLVVAFANFLSKGEKASDALTHAWRVGTRDLSAEERHHLSPIWAKVGRAMGQVWAETHPEDTLLSAEQLRQERQAKLQRSLIKAGEEVPSWPIFALEGEVFTKALASGARPKDALSAAATTLGERKPKVSPAEWSVIKLEWAKITEAVLAGLNSKRKR